MVRSFVCLLVLLGTYLPLVLPQATDPPETHELWSTIRCESMLQHNSTQFRERCESDASFRFYLCGHTCDSVYTTSEGLAESKQKAVDASCEDLFTAHFCLNLRMKEKCQGTSQMTAFRGCMQTCGYCAHNQTVTY